MEKVAKQTDGEWPFLKSITPQERVSNSRENILFLQFDEGQEEAQAEDQNAAEEESG